MLKKQETSN